MKKLKTILQYNKLFICLFLFLTIYIFYFTHIKKYSSNYTGAEEKVVGTITSLSINGDALKMDIKGKEILKVSYYIKSLEEKEMLLKTLNIGDKIEVTGTLSTALHNTIPNTFDYKIYLYRKKIFYQINMQSINIISKNKNPFNTFKNYLLKRIYSLKDNEYLLIFLLGDKSLVNSEEYSDFQKNGTAHLLAISGMHIGILIKGIEILLKRTSDKKRTIITSMILFLFSFLTGFSASVNRVICFYILSNINRYKELNYSNMKILFLTIFILCIINPFIIYDYGFLYSVIITGGILYYSDNLKGNYFIILIKISIISLLFSLPITVNLNYEINLSSILTNLIFVPFVSFIVYPLSLITFLLPNPLWTIIINLFIFLNTFCEKLSIMLIIPKMSIFLILLYYITLLILKKHHKFFIILLLILLLNRCITKLDNHYYVYFLDVGQGDSTVLISPYQKEIFMIDTGGKITYEKEPWAKSNKEYYLSDQTIKFLKSLGISKIDYLILTHGDADHAKEAPRIIEKLKVKNIVLNEGKNNFLEEDILSLKVNQTKEILSKYFQVATLEHKIYDNENDNSIINYIAFKNFSFLFLGDASKKVEEEILDKYDFNFQFLKVGHHGSKTSTSISLLEKNFDTAFIMSGRNNRFKHPSKETIENLEKYSKKYYNTQEKGTIKLKFNDNSYNIFFYEP